MRSLLIVLSLAIPSLARADDHDAIPAARAQLAAHVKALNAGDAKAFAATFTRDGIAVLPGATEEGYDTAGVTAAAKHWLAALGKQTFTIEKPQYGNSGLFGAWYYAELVGKAGRFRATGFVYVSPEADKTSAPQTLALHISAAIDDKTSMAAATGGTLPALTTIPDRDGAGGYAPIEPENATKQIWEGAGVVIGTAPAETAFGKAGLALMKKWKSLPLKATSATSRHESVRPAGLQVIAGHLEATLKTGGKTVKVPYRVLVVYDSAEGADGNDTVGKLLIAHYSVATR